MSPHFGTVGQCLVNTVQHQGSFSTCATHSQPARSKPRSMPPIPVNRDTNLIETRLYTSLWKVRWKMASRTAPG